MTSPADCMFMHIYDIDNDSNIPATTIKEIHAYGNIRELLKHSEYADAFAGETFVHYLLPPSSSSHHRYHTPVTGTVQASFGTSGSVFGYFQFGGSDIVVLFQAGRNPQIDTDTRLRHMGHPVHRPP